MKLFQVFASKSDTMGLDLLLITLFCLGSYSNAQLRERPVNRVAKRDIGTIEFICETEVSQVALNVIWSRWDGTGFDQIAIDNIVNEGYEKYSVEYQGVAGGTSKSVLTSSVVVPEDAGTFQCTTISGNAYAQLIVLDSDPQTSTNTSLDEVIEGETIGLSCFVGYRSGISWGPTMLWRENTLGDLESIDQSTANEARYVYAAVTDRSHDGRTYECRSEFGQIPENNIPEDIRSEHDMSIPVDGEFQSFPLILGVVYPVENLQLADPKSVYNPGESITISAEGRPEPMFSWQNLVDNRTVDNTRTLSITQDMEGVQNWTYMAYNTIKGDRKDVNGFINFLVEIPTTTTPQPTPPPTPAPTVGETTGASGGLSGGAIAGIVIGCLLGLALLILLIFCCISRNKAPKTTKEKSNKANHVDAIRNQPQMVMPPGDIAYIDKEKGPPPYNPYAPPSINTDEGLVYADLAFEDKPRSRKPIQVYENTEYGDIL